jgi:hypothetical protein
MRATLGSKHASRSGRLNAPSPLGLILPTDVAAGAMASLSSAKNWRGVAATALTEAAPTPEPRLGGGSSISQAGVGGVSTTTAWAARPALFVAGEYASLGSRHFGPQSGLGLAPLTSW